jgi:hypothetical protein
MWYTHTHTHQKTRYCNPFKPTIRTFALIKNSLLITNFVAISHAVGALYLAVCYQVISYDSSRGGVSVITEKGDVTTSYLLIHHAEVTDSGKYSCSPSNADVASVKVHVLNGTSPLFRAVK